MMRIFHILLFLILFLVFLLSYNSSANNFNKYLEYAQKYYYLTINEDIGSRVYLKTLKYLKLAKKENQKLKQVNFIKYKINKIRLKSFKKELRTFYSLHKYTMNGFFPLLKFISTSFYFLPEKSKKYTLQENADIIAAKKASKALASKVSKSSQYHIFFNSQNKVWNYVAFEKFNLIGIFYPHLTQDVSSALKYDKNLIVKFYNNKIDRTIIGDLLHYINKDIVFIVTLKKIPLEKGDSYFVASANAYDKNGLLKNKSIITFGYSIDMNWSWLWITGVHLILLFLCLATATYYIKIYGIKKTNTYTVAIAAFVVGRILPWIIIPTLKTFIPSGSLHVTYTIWWIFLVGVVIMVFPIYGIDLVYTKLSKYIKLPDHSGRGSIIGFGAGAGIVGYLSVGYIFNFGGVISNTLFWSTFVLFGIAILISSYVVGLVLDPLYKINELNLIYFAILNTLLFIVFLHGDFLWINATSILVIIGSLTILFVNKHKLTKTIKKEGKEETLKGDVSLKDAIKKTPFYKFGFYKGKK